MRFFLIYEFVKKNKLNLFIPGGMFVVYCEIRKACLGVKHLKLGILFYVIKMLAIVAKQSDIAHKPHEMNREQLICMELFSQQQQ